MQMRFLESLGNQEVESQWHPWLFMGQLPLKSGVSTSGKILFNTENLIDYSQKQLEAIRGKKIAMIFQEPMSALNPSVCCGKTG